MIEIDQIIEKSHLDNRDGLLNKIKDRQWDDRYILLSSFFQLKCRFYSMDESLEIVRDLVQDGNCVYIKFFIKKITDPNDVDFLVNELCDHQYLTEEYRCFSFIEFLNEKHLKYVCVDKCLYVFAQDKENAKIKLDEFKRLFPCLKGTVSDVFSKSWCGYDFYLKDEQVYFEDHEENREHYRRWTRSSLQKRNKEYHLVQSGILSKSDGVLLFESEQNKVFMPVEVTDQINAYDNVTINANTISLLANRGICMNFMDRYGNLEGTFIPCKVNQSALFKQFEKYYDYKERLRMAKKLEIANLHNLKVNLSGDKEEKIHSFQRKMRACKSIQELKLMEAQAREVYYSSFNSVLLNPNFRFYKRTKQPPEDELNAMISFGNCCLYGMVLQMVYRTRLDPRIGVIHGSVNRSHSLDLDMADLFKPIIVDRVIFSLINKKQIDLDCFEKYGESGVYLNAKGKKIFIHALYKKLDGVITIDDEEITYRMLVQREIQSYQNYILNDVEYSPYRHFHK